MASWARRKALALQTQTASAAELEAAIRETIEEAARRCRGDRAYMSTEVERAVARIRAMLADDGAEAGGG